MWSYLEKKRWSRIHKQITFLNYHKRGAQDERYITFANILVSRFDVLQIIFDLKVLNDIIGTFQLPLLLLIISFSFVASKSRTGKDYY